MTRTFTKDELKEILDSHSRWLRGLSDGKRADLTRADLTRADLTRADLTHANLTDADLTDAKDDLFAVLDEAPAEVTALLDTLRAGKVDGSTYEGECACLVGTIANVRGVSHRTIPGLAPDNSRPAERLFLAIRKGDTPANNAVAKIVEGWIGEWQAKQSAQPNTRTTNALRRKEPYMSKQIDVTATETSATITVLGDELAKRANKGLDALMRIADDTTESYWKMAETLAQSARDIATDLRERAARAGDVAVAADSEPGKRQCIALWRDQATHFDMIARAIDTVPISGETLKKEFAEMLINGLNLWQQSPIETRPPMADLMVERAANLAQAYQGRILPEQK